MEEIINCSKSDFLLFLEAPRHLWASKNDLIDKTPSPFEINVMKQGYEVEALAKEYLENYVLKPEENLILQKTFTDRLFTVRTDILILKPTKVPFHISRYIGLKLLKSHMKFIFQW